MASDANRDEKTLMRAAKSPRIIYGTAWKKERTAGLVELAIRSGFRGIDTACQPKHYDEPSVGAGVAACLGEGLRREDLFLQTKFTPVSGQDPKRIPFDPKARLAEQVRASFAVSLASLRTDYVDCLVLHSPLSSFERLMEVWLAMEGLVATGAVKQLGISNCYELATLESLWAAAQEKPSVLQNRFYAETGYDKELRAFCTARGIQYQSFWTLTGNPRLLTSVPVRSAAARRSVSPEEVFFRFVTQLGIVPLTGTSDEAHMRSDLSIFDFELQPHEMVAIEALLVA